MNTIGGRPLTSCEDNIEMNIDKWHWNMKTPTQSLHTTKLFFDGENPKNNRESNLETSWPVRNYVNADKTADKSLFNFLPINHIRIL